MSAIVKAGVPIFRLPHAPPAKPPLFKSSYENGIQSVEMIGRTGRMIEGVCTTPTIDAHKESLSSTGCMIKLPTPLLCSHGGALTRKAPLDRLQIGEVIAFRKSAHQVVIRAVIDDTEAGDFAWRLIQSRALAALSVAPVQGQLRGVVDGVKFFSEWRINEISICRRGANPDCVFWIVE